MATKLGTMVTYLKGYNHKIIEGFDHVVFKGDVTNENHYISSTRLPMATKIGQMVTYLDKILPIKSHELLITWSCRIM